MKTQNTIRRRTQIALGVAALIPSLGLAAITGPYSIDANTLHLYHLDDVGTPAADQAHYTYTSPFTPTRDANQPLTALFGTGNLGNSSYSGFGTSYGAGATFNTAGLGGFAPAAGTGDDVDHTFDNPTTHAFTMEAIVKIGFNPALALSTPQEIIAGEGDAADSSDRSWQFRIEANATPGTTAWRLRFQKVSGFGGVGGSTANYNLDANIPNVGIDAIAQDSWYHVAVTYTGGLADPTSLKLFWTKVDPANTQAALIGSGNMNGWLREQNTDFSIGNELRSTGGQTEGFNGLIDEVRISDIARTVDQFVFVPEPSSSVLVGIGMLAVISRLRRRA
jgi:hypothetical protein